MDIQCDSGIGVVLFRNLDVDTYELRYDLSQESTPGQFGIVLGYDAPNFTILRFSRHSANEIIVSLSSGQSLTGGFKFIESESIPLKDDVARLNCRLFVGEGHLIGLWINDRPLQTSVDQASPIPLVGAFGIRTVRCQLTINAVKLHGRSLDFESSLH